MIKSNALAASYTSMIAIPVIKNNAPDVMKLIISRVSLAKNVSWLLEAVKNAQLIMSA